jgi:integrase
MQNRRKAPKPFKREGSPYYQYDFQVKGQRFRGSTEVSSAREAQRIVEDRWLQARDSVARGEVARDPTIGDVFTRHWTSKASKLDWAPAVAKIMQGILAHVGEDRPWKEVSGKDVSSYVEARFAEGVISMQGDGAVKTPVRVRDLSPATVNRALAVWQTVHKRARDEWEYETRPIAWSVHKQREPSARVRAIDIDQAKGLLAELPKHMQWCVAFSLASGVRRNELFTLTWRRVDMVNREIHVIAKGKHGGTRPVPLTPEAMAIIGAQPKGGPDDFVFETTNWRKLYERALKAADIEDFNWHDLRHTFATWAGRSGAKLEAVSRALGHSTIDVTMRYRHVFDDEVAAALSGMPVLGVTNVDAMPVANHPQKFTTPTVQIAANARKHRCFK